jgi:hypothetical protein
MQKVDPKLFFEKNANFFAVRAEDEAEGNGARVGGLPPAGDDLRAILNFTPGPQG